MKSTGTNETIPVWDRQKKEGNSMMKLSNNVYDILKWLVVIVFPALATLYGVLAGIWGLPYADAIPQTVLAVQTALGAILCISTAQYNKNSK